MVVCFSCLVVTSYGQSAKFFVKKGTTVTGTSLIVVANITPVKQVVKSKKIINYKGVPVEQTLIALFYTNTKTPIVQTDFQYHAWPLPSSNRSGFGQAAQMSAVVVVPLTSIKKNTTSSTPIATAFTQLPLYNWSTKELLSGIILNNTVLRKNNATIVLQHYVISRPPPVV